MFYLGFQLLRSHDVRLERGWLDDDIDIADYIPLEISELEPEFAVDTAAARFDVTGLFESYYQWDDKKTYLCMSYDVSSLLSYAPAACVALEQKKNFDIVIFEYPEGSKLHLLFEGENFVCEKRQWGRETALLYRSEEKSATRIIENFAEAIALFAATVKRVYPEIYHFAPFQEWLHTYEPAYERTQEVYASLYLSP